MKDALSNEIEIGKYYGYSKNSNGITHIKVGEAIKFNEKTVTLRVIYYKVAVYSDNPSEPSYPAETKTYLLKEI